MCLRSFSVCVCAWVTGARGAAMKLGGRLAPGKVGGVTGWVGGVGAFGAYRGSSVATESNNAVGLLLNCALRATGGFVLPIVMAAFAEASKPSTSGYRLGFVYVLVMAAVGFLVTWYVPPLCACVRAVIAACLRALL